MTVQLVTGYDIWECPEHGEWKYALSHSPAWPDRKDTPIGYIGGKGRGDGEPILPKEPTCPWQERNGWGGAIGERCGKKVEWRRYESVKSQLGEEGD